MKVSLNKKAVQAEMSYNKPGRTANETPHMSGTLEKRLFVEIRVCHTKKKKKEQLLGRT